MENIYESQTAPISTKGEGGTKLMMEAKTSSIVCGIVEMEKEYGRILAETLTVNSWGLSCCTETEDRLISMLEKEISSGEVPFEERKYYLEQIRGAAQRKEALVAEYNREMLLVNQRVQKNLLIGLLIGVGTLAPLAVVGIIRSKH